MNTGHEVEITMSRKRLAAEFRRIAERLEYEARHSSERHLSSEAFGYTRQVGLLLSDAVEAGFIPADIISADSMKELLADPPGRPIAVHLLDPHVRLANIVADRIYKTHQDRMHLERKGMSQFDNRGLTDDERVGQWRGRALKAGPTVSVRRWACRLA